MSKRHSTLSIELLKSVLDYNPDTGVFVWKVQRGRMKPGDVAGTVDTHGYIQINTFGKIHLAHRLAWFYTFEEHPTLDIDHVNGNKKDNRISNLRLASQSENSQNQKIHPKNTSGFPGVTYLKKEKKWLAQITYKWKHYYLGRYDFPEDAAEAYKRAKLKLHTFNPTVREA